MLLCEILDKPIRNLRTSQKSVSDVINHPNQSVIGTGFQSMAYLHKKFPNQIIKTIQITGTSDPQYQYLRLVLNHQDNPYFPKVKVVKQFNTSKTSQEDREVKFSVLKTESGETLDDFLPPQEQDYTLYVIMERLHPLPKLSSTELDRLGIRPEIDDIYTLGSIYVKFFINQAEAGRVDVLLNIAFKSTTYRKRILTTANDPNLKQALRLLEPLFKHYSIDMHQGNIMIRGQNQWVFIDPISYNDSTNN